MATTKTYTCICGKTYNHSSNICVHRKKCQQYQSQNNIMTLNIGETEENTVISQQSPVISPPTCECKALKEQLIILQNEMLQLKIQVELKNQEIDFKNQIIHQKDEIINILKTIHQQPTQQPISIPQQPIPQPIYIQAPQSGIPTSPVDHFNMEIYLKDCNTKSFEFVKDFISSNLTEKDLLSACQYYNKQAEVDKLFISKIKDAMTKKIDGKYCYELTPIRVSDIKRKTIYCKENDTWEKISFDEYVKKINSLYCAVQNKLGLMNLSLKNKNVLNNDEYMIDNIKISNHKIVTTLYCEVNIEHIANQMLEVFKIKK